MRALIQRVSEARVSNCDDRTTEPAAIEEQGYAILLGVGQGDTQAEAEKLWNKIAKLRIFEDEQGKTNLSLREVGGEVLVVSQFTLFASCKKGNRPSFTDAATPDVADRLYRYFVDLVRVDGIPVKNGWFGAHMSLEIVNDGPFTIWLDTDAL